MSRGAIISGAIVCAVIFAAAQTETGRLALALLITGGNSS